MTLKLKLQYFGHLMRRVDSLEKILMLGGIGGEARTPLRRQPCVGRHNTKGHCHPRASSAKTRGFHTQLDEGPETP